MLTDKYRDCKFTYRLGTLWNIADWHGSGEIHFRRSNGYEYGACYNPFDIAEYEADFEIALRKIGRADWLKHRSMTGEGRLTYSEICEMRDWLNGK